MFPPLAISSRLITRSHSGGDAIVNDTAGLKTYANRCCERVSVFAEINSATRPTNVVMGELVSPTQIVIASEPTGERGNPVIKIPQYRLSLIIVNTFPFLNNTALSLWC
jgi:hypothetical protein